MNSKETFATKALSDLHDAGTGMRDTVLCVDDDRLVRSTLSRIMSRLVIPGYNVEQAEGYDEAIAKITEELSERLALIVTDTEMPPGESGIELARTLKANLPDAMKKVPVVICSGNTDYGDLQSNNGRTMQNLIDDGTVNIFLKKPFTPDELTNAIVHAVEQVLAKQSK